MDEIVVRPMEMKDLDAVAELEKACFNSPWSRDALLDSLNRPEYVFLVAEISGEVAGYVGLQCVLDEGNITDICTAPAHRRLGVAHALMGELFNAAKKAGIGSIFLEVRETNLAALSLYEETGFERIGIRKNFYEAPMENAVLMRKEQIC